MAIPPHAPAGPATATATVGYLAAAFDSYLVRQGRAPSTRQKYGHVLREFGHRIDGRNPVLLRPGEIDLVLADWEGAFVARSGRRLNRATVRGRICALRSFYRWLEQFDLLCDDEQRPVPNPMRQIIAPTPEQRSNDRLQPAEDFALLSVSCRERDRVAVWLLRWTGLRVAEATSLLVSDLDLTPGNESLSVRSSKTRSGRRSVPVLPELRPVLESWLTQLDAKGLLHPRAPLLPTAHGTSLKPSFVWRMVKRVAFKAGVRVVPCSCGSGLASRHERGCPRTASGENLSRVSPHTLRRTFATTLLNQGVRLEVVSKLLGHASTAVTERAYAELLDDTARRELLHALGHDVD